MRKNKHTHSCVCHKYLIKFNGPQEFGISSAKYILTTLNQCINGVTVWPLLYFLIHCLPYVSLLYQNRKVCLLFKVVVFCTLRKFDGTNTASTFPQVKQHHVQTANKHFGLKMICFFIFNTHFRTVVRFLAFPADICTACRVSSSETTLVDLFL